MKSHAALKDLALMGLVVMGFRQARSGDRLSLRLPAEVLYIAALAQLAAEISQFVGADPAVLERDYSSGHEMRSPCLFSSART